MPSNQQSNPVRHPIISCSHSSHLWPFCIPLGNPPAPFATTLFRVAGSVAKERHKAQFAMLSVSKNHLAFMTSSLSNHIQNGKAKERVKTVPEHTQPQIKTMKPK